MICHGCCVGPTNHFEELALAALSAVREPRDRLLTVRDAHSITSAYKSLIDQARGITDMEALVLLHDDVVLYDRNFAPRVRRVLRDPTWVSSVWSVRVVCASCPFGTGGLRRGGYGMEPGSSILARPEVTQMWLTVC